MAPTYNLVIDGYRDFARYGTVLEQRRISRDGLSGVLDGVNTVFHTSYYPMLTSGSLQVYTSGSLVSGVADYDTGEITLNTPPLAQPKATYTFSPWTSTDVMQFLMSGFDEMESRWNRDWKLVDENGLAATESSGSIYIADSSGSEPVCGYYTFGQSRVQIAFYMACCEYRFRMTQFGSSANSDYMYKSTGGITIDKSRRPGNLQMVMDELNKRVDRALRQAEAQYYPDGSNMGAYVSPPMSADYAATYEWQTQAEDLGVRETLGYNVSIRPFGV